MKLLAAAVAALTLAAARADDKDDAVNAAKKAAEAASYSFKGQTEFELPDVGGFGGGGPQEPQKFEGKHESDVGTHILTDAQEYVKAGGKTVSRPRAQWRLVEEGADEGGRRGGGRAFGRGMMGMFSRTPKAPHEELAGLDSKITGAKKTEKTETVGETDCTVYEVTFTEEAARALIPMGGMLNRIPDAEISGKGKLWIDADGNIHKYQTVGTVSAAFQGMDFEMSLTRTTSIFNVGGTKVEIPEDAKKAMEKKEDY